MKLTTIQLLDLIKNAKSWIDANELAAFFGVSTRTIRNYVKKVNDQYPDMILSSNKGYRIASGIHSEFQRSESASNESITTERIQCVVNHLLVAESSIDIYDLADELAISDAHFERLLQIVKVYLEPFNLKIERKRNKLKLSGSESSKRTMINKLLSCSDEQFVYFSSPFDTSNLVFDLDELKDDLIYIIESFGFYINDYGLNTVLLHVIIMLERVSTGNAMDDATKMRSFSVKELEMINEIQKYVHNKYNVLLHKGDLYWLGVVILNNCANTGNVFINQENIQVYIEPEYLSLSTSILHKLAGNYELDGFTSDFIVNFTIHIRNLMKRANNQNYTMNPLTHTFKGNYPLIYDMATFVAKEISDRNQIKINDDEISFIAFHIGSHLENNNLRKSKINCCFIYADYHNFHVKSIEKIIEHLHSELFISSSISIKNIDKIPGNIELVISCCAIPKNKIAIPMIETTMFISNVDITNIRNIVNIIKNKKKKDKILHSLQLFIEKKLFRKNFYLNNHIDMIQYLANECIELGLCNHDYVNEVLEREQLSSTSFKNGVAFPHSLNMSANHSFLSVIINDKKMKWGENNVNIIMMIGTSLVDRDAFKFLFDELITILYEPDNVRRLIKCNNYEHFTEELATMVIEYN